MTRLDEFIMSERERFAVKDNNKFAISFSHVSRYYEFAKIILQRYEEAGGHFFANNKSLHATLDEATARGGPMTNVEMAILEENRRLCAVLHLEIESFYLFAKILLDRVAHCLEFYFGSVRKKSLDSHDDLVKNFEHYAKEKQLTLPAGFVELAKRLKSDISDYRDYEIAHEKSPRRMNMTLWDANGNVWIGASNIYPTEKDEQMQSKALHVLSKDIDTFLDEVIELVSSNRDNSRLELKQSN